MKLNPNNSIQVFNYSPNAVAMKGTNREYLVPGATAIGPGVEFLSTEDVKYVNSRTPVFKFGILEFADDERDEIYQELHMPNWRDTVLLERDIDEMLLHPTKESLARIIAMNNVHMLERIRGHMVGLVNAKEDVSSRVIKLVNERVDEFKKHPAMPSKIQLVERDYKGTEDNAKVAELQAELEQLKKLLLEKEKAKAEPEPSPAPTPAPKKPAAKKAPAKKSPTR